jgi:pyruvate/2-oxoglutarate dehydrogenase complex dihydrolipoamide acyltransferase (E2) component
MTITIAGEGAPRKPLADELRVEAKDAPFEDAMRVNHDTYSLLPFPTERQLTIEGGRIASRKHTVTGLLEVDVTTARRFLREHKARTGESLSFTAFVIACLGKAVGENKAVHAYRDWRNRLVLFDEVDVNMIVEIEWQGRKVVLPHFIRGANRRCFRDIHAEIRAVQHKPEKTKEFGAMWFVRLPRFVRDIFYSVVFKHPSWLKASFCTVGLTAVGMFGRGAGWAIPFNVHTLDVALGGIGERPGVVDGRIEIREYLCLTLMFDHDIVDGAPAARFTQRLKELIESGYGLDGDGTVSK